MALSLQSFFDRVGDWKAGREDSESLGWLPFLS